MSNKALTSLPAWQALSDHKDSLSGVHMRDLFARDVQRFACFSLNLKGLLFDYSKHILTNETKESLTALARARDVEGQRDAMIAGERINVSENRAVLHMALRGSCDGDVAVDGENVSQFVAQTLQQMQTLSEDIRANENITDVVNIGIGGSDLGPRMVCKALKPFADGPNVHFISNVDASAITQLLKKLTPENTVFIIASKTFTTQETLANAQIARAWLVKALGEDELGPHLVAVSANTDAAQDFGVDAARILPMRDWIGGRYSLWGAIGLPIAIAFGFEAFENLLKGARDMDTHFLNTPLEDNIPVIMALLGVWYRNFCGAHAQAILPYAHDLRDFPVFMQQMDMESNGKAGEVRTGPVVFGESGTNCQHTFMQLLHQSGEMAPADFIVFARPQHKDKASHEKLLAHALAQSKALMEGQENTSEPFKNFPGNRPSSTLVFDTLDAYHLGMLVALYEHKVFVQGAIWGINSFDQWGVELGKSNADAILQALENDYKTTGTDASTAGLLAHLGKNS